METLHKSEHETLNIILFSQLTVQWANVERQWWVKKKDVVIKYQTVQS
jgi:hypothetical protein